MLCECLTVFIFWVLLFFPVFGCGLSNKEFRLVVTLWQIKQVRKAVDFRRTSFTNFCKQRTDISICGKFPCPGSSNSVFECWMAENIWRAGASAWGRVEEEEGEEERRVRRGWIEDLVGGSPSPPPTWNSAHVQLPSKHSKYSSLPRRAGSGI